MKKFNLFVVFVCIEYYLLLDVFISMNISFIQIINGWSVILAMTLPFFYFLILQNNKMRAQNKEDQRTILDLREEMKILKNKVGKDEKEIYIDLFNDLILELESAIKDPGNIQIRINSLRKC